MQIAKHFTCQDLLARCERVTVDAWRVSCLQTLPQKVRHANISPMMLGAWAAFTIPFEILLWRESEVSEVYSSNWSACVKALAVGALVRNSVVLSPPLLLPLLVLLQRHHHYQSPDTTLLWISDTKTQSLLAPQRISDMAFAREGRTCTMEMGIHETRIGGP